MHESLAEIEDERGYRFYVNSATKVKYKENPQLILIIKKIKSNIDVKFASYRISVKLIQLKHSLFSKYRMSLKIQTLILCWRLLLFIIVYFKLSAFLFAAQFQLSQNTNPDQVKRALAPANWRTSSMTSSSPQKRPAFTSNTRTSTSRMPFRYCATFSGTSSTQSGSRTCHLKSSNCRCSFCVNWHLSTHTISWSTLTLTSPRITTIV